MLLHKIMAIIIPLNFGQQATDGKKKMQTKMASSAMRKEGNGKPISFYFDARRSNEKKENDRPSSLHLQ